MTTTIANLLRAFWNRLIPASLREDQSVYRQARRVAAFDLAFIGWIILFAGIYLWLGSQLAAGVLLAGGLAISGSLVALKYGYSPAFCGNLLCFPGWVTLTLLGILCGGGVTPGIMWYACLPVVSLLLCGPKAGIVWTSVALLSIGGFALADFLVVEFPHELTPTNLKILEFAGLAGLVACQFILVWVLVKLERRARRALTDTNRRLVTIRAELESVQASFDFPMAEWAKLYQEKQDLEKQLKDAKSSKSHAYRH